MARYPIRRLEYIPLNAPSSGSASLPPFQPLGNVMASPAVSTRPLPMMATAAEGLQGIIFADGLHTRPDPSRLGRVYADPQATLLSSAASKPKAAYKGLLSKAVEAPAGSTRSGVFPVSSSLSEACRQRLDSGIPAAGSRDHRRPVVSHQNGVMPSMNVGSPRAQVRILDRSVTKHKQPPQLAHSVASGQIPSPGKAKSHVSIPGTDVFPTYHAKHASKVPAAKKLSSRPGETHLNDSRSRQRSPQTVYPHVDVSLRSETGASWSGPGLRAVSPIRSLQSTEPYIESVNVGSSTALFAASLRSGFGVSKRDPSFSPMEERRFREVVSHVVDRLAGTDTSSSFYRRLSSLGEEAEAANVSANREFPEDTWREGLRKECPSSPLSGCSSANASPRAASVTRRLLSSSQRDLHRLPGRLLGSSCLDMVDEAVIKVALDAPCCREEEEKTVSLNLKL